MGVTSVTFTRGNRFIKAVPVFLARMRQAGDHFTPRLAVAPQGHSDPRRNEDSGHTLTIAPIGYHAVMVGFCSSEQFIQHDTGPHHPERPDRIRAIHKAVRDASLIQSPNPFPEFDLDLGLKPLGIAPLVELVPASGAEPWLLTIHPRQYIERVKRLSSLSGVLDQSDTPTEPRSYATALLAVGAGMQCCDAVITGKVKRAFAAVRPPGHHAEPDRPMGFCMFANISIAARYLQQHHGLGKVAIIDFDVHHGNGTQAAFETDPDVMFISLHQDPRTCYPGSGYPHETGVGNVINIPFDPGSDDSHYLESMQSIVLPALDLFRPEILLISAGFDAHQDDPLAQMQLSEDAFETMTRSLVQAAELHCQGRVVSMLEGGYNLRALGRSVVKHLAGLT